MTLRPEQVSGREPVTIVAIEQDRCALNYGVAPCTAAIGTTGQRKCYNTFKTCQDQENYDPSASLTLYFGKAQTAVPAGLYVLPCLLTVSSSPTELNVGASSKDKKPLGTRSSVRITFSDFPHSDNIVDPYLSERSFDPLERGSFWTKWLARNPFYIDRALTIYEGYAGQALEDMTKRRYIIDNVQGPNSKTVVTITAKDILKLADDERAQAPVASPGELEIGIDATATSFAVVGAILDDYPTEGTLRIGDEVMTYTGVTEFDGVLTFDPVTRGTDNTTANSHDAAEVVQSCIRYTDANIWDVAYDLLTNYGNIDPGFINFGDWQSEGQTWLRQFAVTALLTEPAGVTELLGELSEQGLFYIWWDERAQLIKFRALAPQISVAVETDEDNILAESIVITTDQRQRISQVWVYWDLRNPTEKIDEPRSYRSLRIVADLESERPLEYGDRRVRVIFARWIQSDAVAFNLASRVLAKARDTPTFLQADLDAKDRALWTGDFVNIITKARVDDTGLPVQEQWEIISAEERVSGEIVRYKTRLTEFSGGRFFFWTDDPYPSFPDATDEQRRRAGFWADAEGKMSDGSPGWRWI